MNEQLTVGKLLELLRDVDPSLPVVIEGCDCYLDAGGIESRRWQGHYIVEGPPTEVLITHTDG